ncbi:hypothetical protein CVT91_09390 [Candidatus Atribacteria bacterium HGW-Atribacteria-1]|jgi:hypothetical protein|nr:MAG: hypothetical protein CVT91_09390 [Candidatus Atribacteria bacterium HGW-Atribacteria-1]
MKTIFTIKNRNFTNLEFAQKFADKNNLDYTLITESQMEEYVAPKNVFIGKESQEKYNERRANNAKL